MHMNPCLVQGQNWVIAFHRTCLFSIIILEIALIHLLRLLTFCRKRNDCSEPPFILKPTKDLKFDCLEGQIPCETSQLPLATQSSKVLFAFVGRKVQNEPIIKSLEERRENKAVTRRQTTQIFVVELKQLKINGSQLSYALSAQLGPQFISISIAIMYYPLAYATLSAISQLILLTAAYLLRAFCGKNVVAKLLNGAFKVLTIWILLLGLYGLSTNIPRSNQNSCFDL